MTRQSNKRITKNTRKSTRKRRTTGQQISRSTNTQVDIKSEKNNKHKQTYNDFIISPDSLPDIHTNKFKSNALRENSLDDLVKNYDNRPTSPEFLDLYEIKEEYRKVRNQKRSQTCWIYALIGFYETIFNKEYLKIKEAFRL